MGLRLGPHVRGLYLCSPLRFSGQVGTIWFDSLNLFWDLGGWPAYVTVIQFSSSVQPCGEGNPSPNAGCYIHIAEIESPFQLETFKNQGFPSPFLMDMNVGHPTREMPRRALGGQAAVRTFEPWMLDSQ